MTPVDAAWSAGLFEGEGCIALNRNDSGRGGALIVRMTDLDVLERLQAAVQCGRIRGPIAPAKPNHKPSFEWRIGRWTEVERLLLAWLPYLGQRRSEKAAALLAQPRIYVGRQGFDECIRGHALRGPAADVAERVDRAGRTVRECRRCNAERARELRARRREVAA